MKLIQISPGEQRIPVNMGGGIESHIYNMSLALKKLGHDVIIIDRKYTKDDPDNECSEGIKIIRLKASRIKGLPFYFRLTINEILYTIQVRKYLRNNDFDKVHVHNSVSGLFLCLNNKRLREKLFYTSHTSRRVEKTTVGLANLTDKIALIIENQLTKRVTRTITHNEIIRAQIIKDAKVNSEKIVIIPNFINVDNFHIDIDLNSIKDKYNLRKYFSVLFVGRICDDKGIEYLIKAAKKIIQELNYNNTIIILVGPIEYFGNNKTSSSYFSKISKMIIDYKIQKNIIITGSIPKDDLIKLYRTCDIFVLPSLKEAMPNAVTLEAMASGIPMIITDVGGIPENLKNSKCCVIIKPANETELAAAIIRLKNDPEERKKMGIRGQEIAVADFSVDKIAQKLLKVYQNC